MPITDANQPQTYGVPNPKKEKPEPQAPAPLVIPEPRAGQYATGIYDPVVRQAVASAIHERAKLFSITQAQDHPLTVAQLVKSSIPTPTLATIAQNMDKAWEHVQRAAAQEYREAAIKQQSFLQRDPYYDPVLQLANSLDDFPGAAITAITKYRTGQPLTGSDRAAMESAFGTYDGNVVSQMIEGAAKGLELHPILDKYNVPGKPSIIQTDAKGKPSTAPGYSGQPLAFVRTITTDSGEEAQLTRDLQGNYFVVTTPPQSEAGNTVPYLAAVASFFGPAVGAISVKTAGEAFLFMGAEPTGKALGIKPLEQLGHTANALLTGGVRGIEDIISIPIAGVGQALGHDTHWKDMLSFWDEKKNNPLVEAAFSLSGDNINDPANQRKIEALNAVGDLAGIVATGVLIGKMGELAHTPGEVGGYFSTDSVLGKFMTRKFFPKAEKIINESTSPEDAIGNLELAGVGDPLLADRLVKGYKTGGVDGMRREFREYAEEANAPARVAKLQEERDALVKQLSERKTKPVEVGTATPKLMKSQGDIGQIGVDNGNYVYRIDKPEDVGRISTEGYDPTKSPTGKTYFSDDPFKTYKLSDRVTAQGAGGEFNIYRMEKDHTDLEQPGEFVSREHISPQRLEVFTENGWRPVNGLQDGRVLTGEPNPFITTEIDALDSHINALANKQAVTRFPEIRGVSGVIHGAPPTNWVSEVVDAVYSHRPDWGVADLSKVTDNIKANERWWNPFDSQKPADWAEQTINSVRKRLAAAKVATDKITQRIAEYNNIRSRGDYYRWIDGITDDLISNARNSVAPETIDAVTHPMRNVEAARAREQYEVKTVENGRPETYQRSILKTEAGKPLPVFEPDFAGSVKAIDMKAVREITSWTRDVAKRTHTSIPIEAIKKFNRMVTGTAKALIIAFRPKIAVAIQFSQWIVDVLHGSPGPGYTARVLAYMRDKGIVVGPGGVMLDLNSISLIAERWWDSVGKAREAMEQYALQDPRDMGQAASAVTEFARGPVDRIPVPIGDFKDRFLKGATSADENTAVANDIHWEIQKLHGGSPTARSLVFRGVDETARRMVDSTLDYDLHQFYVNDLKPNIDEAYARDTGTAELVETLKGADALIDEITGHNPEWRKAVGSGVVEVPWSHGPRMQEIIDEIDAMSQAKTGNPEMDLQINDEILRLQREGERIAPKRTVTIDDREAFTNHMMNSAQEGNFELPSRVYREVERSSLSGVDEGLSRRKIRQGFSQILWRGTRWWSRFDTTLTRGRFWQGNYTVWHDRLTAAGVSEERAGAVAIVEANKAVRDWFHDIGNRSSLQEALKSELPFAHAWQKVAWTWFYKLPKYVGGDFGAPSLILGYQMGTLALHDLHNLLKATGVMQDYTTPDGKNHEVIIAPNPMRLLSWFPGLNEFMKVPNEVIAMDPGHVFIPLRILQGEIPGISPQAGFLLNEAAMAWGGTFKQINNIFTHNGAFQPAVPGVDVVTNIYEAVTGKVPPWSVGRSGKYQQYIMDRTQDAALRYAFTDLSKQGLRPPNPADFATQEEFNAARDDYWAQAHTLAKQYYYGLLWSHAYSSTTSILSFTPTTKEEIAWKAFLKENGITGKRTEADYALIDKYLAAHPNSLAFNISMYDRTNKYPKDPSYEAFRKAVGDGNIKVNTPERYAAALALGQQWSYFNEKKRQLLDAAGLGNWENMTAAQRLSRWGEYLDATGPAWDDFQTFLGGNKIARQMYKEGASDYQKAMDSIGELEAHRKILERDGVDVDAKISAVYDKLADSTEYGKTTAEHLTWYRAVAANEYYNKILPLYDKIGTLKESRDPNANDKISAIYDKIRSINNSYHDGYRAPDGTMYPSPEAFAYSKLPEADQLGKRTEWAQLPTAWLSQFQYETAFGIKTNPDTEKYLGKEQQIQKKFDEGTANLSHSSNEYDNWVTWRDQSLNYWADNIGGAAKKLRGVEKDVPIGRLQTAGILPDTPNMKWIVDYARWTASKVKSLGLSIYSSSHDAEFYRGYVENYIRQMRDPNSNYYDPAVDKFFRQQASATGITNEPALYRDILWGTPSGFWLPLDFQYENQIAAGKAG